jgi:hypothetical protein
MKNYKLDLSEISLDRFMEITRHKRLVPGRKVLQEEMESRFRILREAGVTELGGLLGLIGPESGMENFSKRSGLPLSYLLLLKREAASYQVSPISLGEIPGIPLEYVEMLRTRSIKNTRDFFEASQTGPDRSALASNAGIPEGRIMELHSLCDLTRVTGIGGTFSRVLYHAGIRSVEQLAQVDEGQLYQLLMDISEPYKKTIRSLGPSDLNYCIEYARIISEIDRITTVREQPDHE